MRISRITVWQKTLPLVEPYQLSGGRLAFESLDSTFVRIDTDEGLAGWAEGCRSHSAKIGDSDPPADIARIEAIEAERLPDEQVTYDVNRAWTPALAVEVMNTVAVHGWFEQRRGRRAPSGRGACRSVAPGRRVRT